MVGNAISKSSIFFLLLLFGISLVLVSVLVYRANHSTQVLGTSVYLEGM